MDVVLIAVVALCTVENDVIHAAYLAIALLFFRRRDALRREGNKWFRWLPTYNFLVMLITLIYQAPWPAIFEAHSKGKQMRVCLYRHLISSQRLWHSSKPCAS